MFAPWRAWQERSRASACAREVLRLHRLLDNAQPWLSREQRYREVVAAYMLCSPADATALVRCAAASFASWPAQRDLTLRDVAHYLAVSELLAASGDIGVQAHLKPLIDAAIPSGL